MIRIQKCPRLGDHGWQATVSVGEASVDILLVGARAAIQDSAERAERALKEQAKAAQPSGGAA